MRRATARLGNLALAGDISIHALREEGDPLSLHLRNLQEFLSTPSVRRATHNNFAKRVPVLISIHALREEGDVGGASWSRGQSRFLSTPSVRRATVFMYSSPNIYGYFYPRPP